jgi:hypothetical protein
VARRALGREAQAFGNFGMANGPVALIESWLGSWALMPRLACGPCSGPKQGASSAEADEDARGEGDAHRKVPPLPGL